MNNELAQQLWPVIKNLVAIVEQQQQQLVALFRSHSGLIDALRSEAGLESDASPLPIDRGDVERAKNDVLELERLFGLGEGVRRDPNFATVALADADGEEIPGAPLQ